MCDCDECKQNVSVEETGVIAMSPSELLGMLEDLHEDVSENVLTVQDWAQQCSAAYPAIEDWGMLQKRLQDDLEAISKQITALFARAVPEYNQTFNDTLARFRGCPGNCRLKRMALDTEPFDVKVVEIK